MTKEELDTMCMLFSKYCRNEVENRTCQPGDCRYCPVEQAYDRIIKLYDDFDNI